MARPLVRKMARGCSEAETGPCSGGPVEVAAAARAVLAHAVVEILPAAAHVWPRATGEPGVRGQCCFGGHRVSSVRHGRNGWGHRP